MQKLSKDIQQLDQGGMKFLTPQEIQKKYKLQDLLVQRQQAYHKELQYLDNLGQFRQSYLLEQKQGQPHQREQLLKHKLQYEQILTEKAKILRDSTNPQILTSAGMQVFQDVTQNYNYNAAQAKLQSDQARLLHLKAQQRDEMMHQEFDELINSGPGDNLRNQVKYLYKGNLGSNQRDQLEKLQFLRQQLEEYNHGNSKLVLPFEEVNQEKTPEQTTLKYQNEVDQLRNDYVQAGGTDPNFLLNLSHIEKSMNRNNSMHQLNQNSSYNANNKINYQINNQSYLPTNNHSTSQLDTSKLQSHPIFTYLPNSFKEELLSYGGPTLPKHEQKKNEQETVDDVTLNYLRNQEAELLLQMSRLDARHPEHERLMEQYRELLKLRNSIEKQIFDKRVAEAIKKEDRLRKNLIKGKGMFAGDRHARAVNYAASEGFILYIDYISNLQIQYHTCRINYGIFRKGDDMYPYRQTKDAQSAFETFRSNKVVFFERELTRDLESFPDTYIFFELWGYPTDKPEVVGWTLLRIFDEEQRLLTGKFRLPLYSRRLNPNFLFTQPLPYFNSTLIYVRVSLPGDPILDSEDIILVESEYNMPDMHIHTTAHIASLAEIEKVYLKDEDEKSKQSKKSIPAVDLSSLPLPSQGATSTNKNSKSARTSRFRKSRQSLNKSPNKTPSSSKTQKSSDSPNLVFRLVKLGQLEPNDFEELKLKLGIFFGAKMLEDVSQQPQMALLDLIPINQGDQDINFNTKHDFTIDYEWIQNFKGEECMIFMGFFKNKKDLFGWLAIPLFHIENGEYTLKLGNYSTNLLAPPGQSPPFNQEAMKKQEIEINFILMTSDQKASQLPLFDNYQSQQNKTQQQFQKAQSLNKSQLSNPNKSSLSVPSIFSKKEQTQQSQSQIQQKVQIIKLVLESVNNIPTEGEYALKVAIASGSKIVYDIDDRPCTLTTISNTTNRGILNMNDDVIEFEVDFDTIKNRGVTKESCLVLIYVITGNQTITWYVHDLTKFGRYCLPTLQLPWQKPPINKNTLKNHTLMTISFDLKQVK